MMYQRAGGGMTVRLIRNSTLVLYSAAPLAARLSIVEHGRGSAWPGGGAALASLGSRGRARSGPGSAGGEEAEGVEGAEGGGGATPLWPGPPRRRAGSPWRSPSEAFPTSGGQHRGRGGVAEALRARPGGTRRIIPPPRASHPPMDPLSDTRGLLPGPKKRHTFLEINHPPRISPSEEQSTQTPPKKSPETIKTLH